MKHLLIAVAVYTTVVLEIAGASAAVGLGHVDLFAAVGLLSLCHCRGNVLLGWLALIGLLGDALHQSPLGIGMGIGVALGYAFEGTTRDGATGSRWLAQASFLVLFQLLVAGARGILAESPIPSALASAIVPAAVTLFAVFVVQIVFIAVQVGLGGRLRPSRHGF